MAGLIKVLDQFYASGGTTSPALASATKHWDLVFVSKYYNWKPGAYKNAYVHVSSYKLKPDAPDDAVDMLSKQLVVPMLEKLLADGSFANTKLIPKQFILARRTILRLSMLLPARKASIRSPRQLLAPSKIILLPARLLGP